MSDATLAVCIVATGAFIVGLSFAMGVFDAWLEDAGVEENNKENQTNTEESKCNNR